MALKDKFNNAKDKLMDKGRTHLDEHGDEYKDKGRDYFNDNKDNWKDRLTGKNKKSEDNK